MPRFVIPDGTKLATPYEEAVTEKAIV